VFLCLFWAMFLCPVRACFLACAPSGFFWAFFCASFFEGNKSSRGVSPPPPPRCFASQGRGLGTRTEHGGAWAHGRNMARGHNGPPGACHSSAPAPLPGELVPGGGCGRVGQLLKSTEQVRVSVLDSDKFGGVNGCPAAASLLTYSKRSGHQRSGVGALLCSSSCKRRSLQLPS
jgi:hypothetical protein